VPIHKEGAFALPRMLDIYGASFPADPGHSSIEAAVFSTANAIYEQLGSHLNEMLRGQSLGVEVYDEILGLTVHLVNRWAREEVEEHERGGLPSFATRIATTHVDLTHNSGTLGADSEEEAYQYVWNVQRHYLNLFSSRGFSYENPPSMGLDDRLDKSRTVLGLFATECAIVLEESRKLQLEALTGTGYGEAAANVGFWAFENSCVTAVAQGMAEAPLIIWNRNSGILDGAKRRYHEDCSWTSTD
jgi:hypothetical protein